MASHRLRCFHHSSICASSACSFVDHLSKFAFFSRPQKHPHARHPRDSSIAPQTLGYGRAYTRKKSTQFFESHHPPGSRCARMPSSASMESSRRGSSYVIKAQAVDAREMSTSSNMFQNVFEILEERGLIESFTGPDLRVACSKPHVSPLKVYCGFDPTAESLHLGNLLGIVVLSWFQRCGHIPVAVLGGATGRVGDPSGKSVERPVLGEETICRNLTGLQALLTRMLTINLDGKVTCNSEKQEVLHTSVSPAMHSPIILNNYDWWKNFSLLDFLRDVGKYARVGTMIAKESVKKRLVSEEGISFTEFTYQLLQGYDFVHLFKEEGVSVQIGGSDQWGNITAGTDLVRRLLQQDGAHGLTFPLLLKSDGTKFGKSEGGAIWLSPSLLSPYKFYQSLVGIPDSDVIKLLKMLTFVSLEEIARIEADMETQGCVPNTAQRRLAEEVTRFVHGEQGLAEALKATEALSPGSNTELDCKTLEAIAEDVPSLSLPRSSLVETSLVDICVVSGLTASKGAARRLIKQGGLYLNNEKVGDEGKLVHAVDFLDDRILLLSAGKKNKLMIRIQ